jgi:hypothetical protein
LLNWGLQLWDPTQRRDKADARLKCWIEKGNRVVCDFGDGSGIQIMICSSPVCQAIKPVRKRSTPLRVHAYATSKQPSVRQTVPSLHEAEAAIKTLGQVCHFAQPLASTTTPEDITCISVLHNLSFHSWVSTCTAHVLTHGGRKTGMCSIH